MTEHDLTRVLHEAADSVHFSAETRAAILNETNGGRPMKKKLTASAVLAIALALTTMVVAVAEVLRFNLGDFMDYRHFNKPENLEALTQPYQGDSVEVNGVVFTPVEYICDEHTIFLSMEVQAKSSDVLLIPAWMKTDMWIGNLGPDYRQLPSEMTIAQYAEERGLSILYVSLTNENEPAMETAGWDTCLMNDQTMNLLMYMKPQGIGQLVIQPLLATTD